MGFGNKKLERVASKQKGWKFQSQDKACVPDIDWLFPWIMARRDSQGGIGLCLWWECSWTSDIFTKSGFTFTVFPMQSVGNVLRMAAYFQREKNGECCFILLIPVPFGFLVRLCVDPDFGWDDPGDGPWPGGAGGVGRWFCAVQWGPCARPGPESQQVSSGRWVHFSHLSWSVGEPFAHCFLFWVQNFQIHRLNELIHCKFLACLSCVNANEDSRNTNGGVGMNPFIVVFGWI